MKELDQKQIEIIEAALKRFSHFGISKTTMNEIADDISLSKASLYYYFPDKPSLILAVARYTFDLFLNDINSNIHKDSSLKDAIYAVIETRSKYIQKFYMLHFSEWQTDIQSNLHAITELKDNAEKKLNSFIVQILKREIKAGRIRTLDPDTTIELITKALFGVYLSAHIKLKGAIIPDDTFFKKIESEQKAIFDLLMKGLQKN